MKIKKTILGAATITGLAMVAIILPQKAEASSGTVYVQPGNRMVGMWVHVEGGQSGWANWWNKGNNQYGWSYDTQGKKWTADVGVNGSPQSWAINARSFNWTYHQGNNISIQVYPSSLGWRTVVPQ